MDDWTKQDSTAARTQGWDVFDIWDGRLLLEIQRDDASNIFLTDEAARASVKEKANASSFRDALCHKAWVLVFKSKTTPQTTSKQRRKR